MKIKVGATTGSRVVFDEDGQAVQPLARLAMAEGCGHPHTCRPHAEFELIQLLPSILAAQTPNDTRACGPPCPACRARQLRLLKDTKGNAWSFRWQV